MAAPPPPFGITLPTFVSPQPPDILKFFNPINQLQTVDVIKEVPKPQQPTIDVDIFKVPQSVGSVRGGVPELNLWTLGGVAIGLVLVIAFLRIK